MGNTLPLPDPSTQHMNDGGKPTKDFYNWLRSLGDFVNKNIWPSLVVGSPTGGNKGDGTVNAQALYNNGVPFGTASTKDVGTAANDVVQLDASAKLPAVDGSQLTGIAQAGRLIAGTSLVQNPFAQSQLLSQAHGLSGKPVLITTVLECLTSEAGYGVGEQVWILNLNQFGVSADATNVYMQTSNANPRVYSRTSPATSVVVTAANWKLVATPYKLS